MSSATFKLPACERCRIRKSKCDNKGPKCTACQRGNAACIIVDSINRERHSRGAIYELEKKLEALEARWTQQAQTSPSGASQLSSRRPREKQHYVGAGSGLGLFERVSSSAYAANARPEVLRRLSFRSPITPASIPAHELPSFETTCAFLDRYFSHSHLHHPFLSHRAMSGVLQRVYHRNGINPSKEDLFRIFMVIAISSVTKYRKGEMSENPYGYYCAAQRFIPGIQLIGSINGIQNLLLIARFAMYYHIDCSIWDIAQLCMRQCIELGLHRKPAQRLSPAEEQHQRNVFWDCYVHDRYSSGILGRPFAIAEQDIEVSLPIMASEHQILLQPDITTMEYIHINADMLPNETSVFLFVIGLRRITTRIHTRFYSSQAYIANNARTISNVGQVLTDMHNFMRELDNWRASAPVFGHVQSLYERSEWYDFLVEKDRLSLIRGALAQLPISSLHPPRDLLILCLKCATNVIELYVGLFGRGHITWTRSYFQILFTSGLSVMYALPVLKTASQDPELETILQSASTTLISCSELLTKFVAEMPDAGRFAAIFEALSKQYLSSSHINSGMQTPRQQPIIGDFEFSSQLETTWSANELSTSEVQNNNSGSGQTSVPGAGRVREDMELGSPGYSSNDFNLQLGFEDFQNWSFFPSNPESFLGQMEVGLGEYAWAAPTDNNVWEQYFSSR